MDHLSQPGRDDFSETTQIGIFSFRQGFCFADQVAQARLAVDPFTVQGITVAAQYSFPVLDQLFERLLGPVRIDAIEGETFEKLLPPFILGFF